MEAKGTRDEALRTSAWEATVIPTEEYFAVKANRRQPNQLPFQGVVIALICLKL